MRPPADRKPIPAPPFPRELPWVNVAPLRMDKQRGRVVLVEFWDFCRINSLRTLPYVQQWHERYAERGLRVIGVHTGGFECSRDPDAVRTACERLGVAHPVVIDVNLEIWDHYGNQGWPARYLWDQGLALHSWHYGEGAYGETEREIQALLRIADEPLAAPVRPEDDPDALLVAQTPDQPGAYCGPYEAGGVHVVCDGTGEMTVNGAVTAVDGCGVHTVLEHERHTEGVLELAPGPGVAVLQTCFTPGLAPPG